MIWFPLGSSAQCKCILSVVHKQDPTEQDSDSFRQSWKTFRIVGGVMCKNLAGDGSVWLHKWALSSDRRDSCFLSSSVRSKIELQTRTVHETLTRNARLKKLCSSDWNGEHAGTRRRCPEESSLLSEWDDHCPVHQTCTVLHLTDPKRTHPYSHTLGRTDVFVNLSKTRMTHRVSFA